MKFIPILLITLLLQGCTLLHFFKKPEPPPAIPPTTKTANLDSASLLLCDKLKEAVDVKSFEEIIAVYGELTTQYVTCANRQSNSVKLLKQFGNIK
jgi:hypothetical protein